MASITITPTGLAAVSTGMLTAASLVALAYSEAPTWAVLLATFAICLTMTGVLTLRWLFRRSVDDALDAMALTLHLGQKRRPEPLHSITLQREVDV